MKRITASVLLFLSLLLLFSSCGETVENDNVGSVSVYIDGTYRIISNNSEFTAKLYADSAGSKITFLSPDGLSGLVVTDCNGERLYEINGVTSVHNARETSDVSVTAVLFSLMHDISAVKIDIKSDEAAAELEMYGFKIKVSSSGEVLYFSDLNGKTEAVKI